MANKKRWALKPTFESVVGCDRRGRIVESRLRLRSGFTKANDFFAGLVLAAFLKQFDAFEALENVALSGDGAGSFEAAVLRHKNVKLSGEEYDKRTEWEGQKAFGRGPMLASLKRTPRRKPEEARDVRLGPICGAGCGLAKALDVF